LVADAIRAFEKANKRLHVGEKRWISFLSDLVARLPT